MCNDFGNRIPYRAYVEKFSHMRLPLVFPKPDSAPNLQPRDEIWPTELAPVIRPVEGGVELVQLPWGLSPSRPKGRAVINLRSEGRAFTRGRCLVPASYNRQPVILDRADWAAWLTSSEPPRDLLVPSPPGSLEVRECPREGERVSAEPDLLGGCRPSAPTGDETSGLHGCIKNATRHRS